MERHSLSLLLIFVIGVVVSVSAYSDDEVRRYINQIPEEERDDFLRYAIIRGYELVEKKSSGLDVPHINRYVKPSMLRAIYMYFWKYHSVGDQINFPFPMDVICFPSGCIEINDPGIHP